MTEEYFIDPDLRINKSESVHNTTKHLASWLLNDDKTKSNSQISILIANGGVGKTTVSRVLCNEIRKNNKNAFPILIESEQWGHLFQSSITLDKLWDIALQNRFDNPSKLLANETALRVLIQEGLFIVIFDGFDELCSYGFSPQDIIDELTNLITPEDDILQARLLLTARETFWKSIEDEIDQSKVDLFYLKGFDNEQRKRYFNVRLKDPSERDIAFRLSRQISGGLFENIGVEGINEDRPSGVPFI